MARRDAAPMAAEETSDPNRARAKLRAHRRLVPNRIWTLLRHLRHSADLTHRRLIDLSEVERRLLIEVEAGSVERSADFILLTGCDKAQVSRAVRRLVEVGLLERHRPRSLLEASGRGHQIARQLVEIAAAREAELLIGISPRDLMEFVTLAAELTARAIALSEQEPLSDQGRHDDQRTLFTDSPGLVSSQLSALFSYLQRHNGLMARRLADLSNFESLVLSTIVDLGPLTSARLIDSVDRDHSQTRRSARRLVKLRLIESFAMPRQRGRLLRPTKRGAALAGQLEQAGWQRDSVLYGEIEEARLGRFLAVLDVMISNALAQFEREKATSIAA